MNVIEEIETTDFDDVSGDTVDDLIEFLAQAVSESDGAGRLYVENKSGGIVSVEFKTVTDSEGDQHAVLVIG